MPAAVLATGLLTSVITAPAQELPAPVEATAVDTNGWYADRTSGKAVEARGASTADGGNVVSVRRLGQRRPAMADDQAVVRRRGRMR
ncbi:hypothetical protein GCM10009716_18270 [Streptomyces sodiiphilus]|uniref:Uncharacterized protein n=1 Tax=Streptomyces sodiiphilus TaxID=226217 RepID=A0ABN2P117_9ACTN